MNAAWLLLLLPLAAASGWWFASRKFQSRERTKLRFEQSCLMGINRVLAMEDDEALTSFLNAMGQQTKSVELQMVLGSVCRRKGEYERASLIHQAILNNLTHSSDTREQAQFELAQDYQAAGWLDRSESLYVELVDSQRFQRETAINLIRIYQLEKDWENAVQIGKNLREQGHDSDSLAEQLTHFYCELCEQCIHAGRFPLAENYLCDAEKIDSANPRVIILKGRMATFKGDHPAAISAWQKLKLIAPEFLGMAMQHIQDSYLVLQDEKGYHTFLQQAARSSQDPEILGALLEIIKAENSLGAGRFLVQYMKEEPNIEGLKQILSNWKDVPAQISRDELLLLVETLLSLVQKEDRFQCGGCGFKAEKFEWSCPSCSRWGEYKRKSSSLPAPRPLAGTAIPERLDNGGVYTPQHL